jgi:hypothetical protein
LSKAVDEDSTETESRPSDVCSRSLLRNKQGEHSRVEQTGNEYWRAAAQGNKVPLSLDFLNPTTDWTCIVLRQYRSRHFVLLEHALVEFDRLS